MSDTVSKLSFEEASARLDALIAAMEKGEVKLDQLVKSHEEAGKLLSHLEKLLADAKMKIEKVVHDNN
ncbi:MAG: exodeoxyribonuclease VII small subunit [Alphaproteobacteria bacterium]|nr:exodeoxyribonuclease VII small subunit [Alphaproteobacteria bacterium]